ncbi:Baseplate J-like protein [Pelotomaculum schinkii]|uniref:Baseplate J-like protein n=1 Tax=Pelotomaculum schinkii TaxID=78350 RepID=A0A4Y7RHS8_9FIRM|nr:baseplate J/gp47 family protein [Pelotomaculum schinkii]TEB07867.1 Baseplate J-like protein [Pelotomaculum schinkii]
MSTSNGQNGSDTSNRPHIDYTDKDYDSLRDAMLALATEKLPGWTDHSANDPGVVLLELFAYMGDLILYYQDRIANESFLDTAVERSSVINLLRLIGYELRPPQPASVDLTLLFKPDIKTDAGTVTIDDKAEFKTTAGPAGGDPVSFRYVRQPLTIDLQLLPLIQHTDGKTYRCYDSLPVIQVDSVQEKEIVGSSDNSSGQRFRLAGTPLIVDSLEVYVDGEKWERRETLFYSDSAGKHYVVRRDESDVSWIEFGDGNFGSIPRKGSNNITASYRTGGGIKGNIPKNSIFKVSAIGDPGSNLQLVFNPNASSGGMEREDCAQAVLRGPQLFRARSRAVTGEDYEAYARDFGVAKVRAQAANWNTVELYVAPAGGGKPSDTLKEDLRLYFEDKRMLTTIIEVKDPVYVDVMIEGDLFIKPQYFRDSVRQRVEDAVNRLLAFENVDFARVLYVSKVYEVIEAIEGVEGVTISGFERVTPPPEGLDPKPVWGVLRFDWNEIPYLSGINFKSVTGGQSGR